MQVKLPLLPGTPYNLAITQIYSLDYLIPKHKYYRYQISIKIKICLTFFINVKNKKHRLDYRCLL